MSYKAMRLWLWIVIIGGGFQAYGAEHGWSIARTEGLSQGTDYLTGFAMVLVGLICQAIVWSGRPRDDR